MSPIAVEVKRLRKLGSLNYRKAERAKAEHNRPIARHYRARSNEFYSMAGALIMAASPAAAHA